MLLVYLFCFCVISCRQVEGLALSILNGRSWLIKDVRNHKLPPDKFHQISTLPLLLSSLILSLSSPYRDYLSIKADNMSEKVRTIVRDWSLLEYSLISVSGPPCSLNHVINRSFLNHRNGIIIPSWQFWCGLIICFQTGVDRSVLPQKLTQAAQLWNLLDDFGILSAFTLAEQAHCKQSSYLLVFTRLYLCSFCTWTYHGSMENFHSGNSS